MPRRAEKAKAEPAAGKQIIQSAARIVHVFHHLVRFPEGQQLSEISRGVGLSEVTTLRLLQTLIHEGVVRKDPERGRYRGAPLFWLTVAAAFPDVSDVQRHLRACMLGLAQRTGAVAMLGIPHIGTRNIGVVSSVSAEPTQPLPAPLAINIPMHAVAGGKCYLASLSEEALEEWLRGRMARVTPRTCISPKALAQEIRQVREQGYATDEEEHMPGVWGLAVAIKENSGAVAAALQLCAPLATRPQADVRHWLPLLQSASRAIEQKVSVVARLG